MGDSDWTTKPVDLNDPEELDRLAKKLGVPPDKIKSTVYFSMAIHELADNEDLDFQQCLSGLLSVVSDLLKHNVPLNPRAELVTDIYQTLWGSCGLPTDMLPKVENYGTKGQKETTH